MKKTLLLILIALSFNVSAKTNIMMFGNSIFATFPKKQECNYLSQVFMGTLFPGLPVCDGVSKIVKEQLNSIGISVYDNSVPGLSTYDVLKSINLGRPKDAPAPGESFIEYTGVSPIVNFMHTHANDKNIFVFGLLENDYLRMHENGVCFTSEQIVKNQKTLIEHAKMVGFNKIFWVRTHPGYGDSVEQQAKKDLSWCPRTTEEIEGILADVTAMTSKFGDIGIIDVALDGFTKETLLTDSIHPTTLGQFIMAAEIIKGIRYELSSGI